jgi:pilus assembly protein CpaE
MNAIPRDRTTNQPEGRISQSRQASAPEHRVLRVVLAVIDPSIVTWIRDTLSEHPLVDIAAEAHDGLEAAQLARQLMPDVCVIQADLPVMDGYETCELIRVASPQVITILVHGQTPPPGAERSAMGSGARGCVTAGTDAQELLAMMADAAEIALRRDTREFAQVTDLALMPSTVVVTSAKGGVGKTTVACNLAVTMAQKHPGQSVLVDFHPEYGDAAVLLGLAAPGIPNIVDLAVKGADIDEAIVEDYLLTHTSGLRLLPGATQPDVDNPPLSVDFAGKLLTILRRQFRWIIVDVPPTLTPAIAHVISRCQHFLVICNLMELHTLHDTSQLVAGIVGKYVGSDRTRLIANRVVRSNCYLAAELEAACGQPVLHSIPDAADIALEAVNTAVPFVTGNPRAAISVSIRELADAITPGAPLRRSDDVQVQPSTPPEPKQGKAGVLNWIRGWA